MIALATLLLITAAHTHKVVESTEDVEPSETNITHLYPVHVNITNINFDKIHKKNNQQAPNEKAAIEVNTTFLNDKNQTKDNSSKETIKTHEEIKNKLPDKTTWKIAAAYAEPDLSENDEVESKNATKLFRPSQLLGYIVDEVTPRNVYEDFSTTVTRPATEFSSIQDDDQPAIYKRPKELQEYKPFPYEYESYIKPIGSWSPDTLISQPTEEVPVKVPAGGLYQYPEVFDEHSLLISSHENTGYEIKEGVQEYFIKKRVNPWKDLLRVVSAIIPAGLLISALTPNIINVSPDSNNYYPPTKLRRSADGGADLMPISERCRRRLLCELYSEKNYSHNTPPPARGHRQCYKIYCEDHQALFRMLQWLLSHHNPTDNRARENT